MIEITDKTINCPKCNQHLFSLKTKITVQGCEEDELMKARSLEEFYKILNEKIALGIKFPFKLIKCTKCKKEVRLEYDTELIEVN